MSFPQMAPVRQHFARPQVEGIEQTVRAELERVLADRDICGKSIALAAGSRGVRNIGLILRTLVAVLKEHGATPFIVPAMGSHTVWLGFLDPFSRVMRPFETIAMVRQRRWISSR